MCVIAASMRRRNSSSASMNWTPTPGTVPRCCASCFVTRCTTGSPAAGDHLADLRPLRVGDSDEVRPEPRLVPGVRVLAYPAVEMHRLAGARQVEFDGDRSPGGRRLETAHEHALLAERGCRRLDRDVAGRETDGKDDGGGLHELSSVSNGERAQRRTCGPGPSRVGRLLRPCAMYC